LVGLTTGGNVLVVVFPRQIGSDRCESRVPLHDFPILVEGPLVLLLFGIGEWRFLLTTLIEGTKVACRRLPAFWFFDRGQSAFALLRVEKSVSIVTHVLIANRAVGVVEQWFIWEWSRWWRRWTHT